MLGSRRRSATHADAQPSAEAVVEELPDPVVTCDARGRVSSNRRARELHGLPREPLATDRWAARHRVYYPGGERVVPAGELPLIRALAGAEVRGFEVELHPRRAPRRAFVVSGQPLRARGDGIVGAVSVLHDAGVAEPIPPPAAPAAPILANMAEGVALICAVDGVFVYTNEAWDRMLGYEAGELLGRHVSTVNAASDRPPEAFAAEMQAALAAGSAWRGEMEHVRKDGTRLWSELTVSGVSDDRGRSAWIAVGSDITERRMEAAALREEERRFRSTFEAGPFGMALVGDDLRLLEVNEAFAAITGHTRDELLGLSLEALTYPADLESDRDLAGQVRRGEIARYQLEMRYRAKNGEPVPVGVTATIVRGVDGRPLHGVVMVDRLDAEP